MGASLLAMAVDQLASMLDVPTSSRASSLPHWIGGEPQFIDWHRPPVGASLLAIAVDQLASMLNMPTSSRASLNWSTNFGHQLRFHAASFSIATGDR
nr:hypothetical protein C1892_28000 [Pseudomonas sp. MPBD7-1]